MNKFKIIQHIFLHYLPKKKKQTNPIKISSCNLLQSILKNVVLSAKQFSWLAILVFLGQERKYMMFVVAMPTNMVTMELLWLLNFQTKQDEK